MVELEVVSCWNGDIQGRLSVDPDAVADMTHVSWGTEVQSRPGLAGAELGKRSQLLWIGLTAAGVRWITGSFLNGARSWLRTPLFSS